MGDMNFPDNPALDEGYLDWSWDGEKWVHNGLTGLESKPANITTRDVKLTNPQRFGFNTQEDANDYFYESIQNGGGGGGGGNDPRITNQQITNWDISFGWGDHSAEGYLKVEADPTVPDHVKAITLTDIANWNAGTGGGGGGNDPRITNQQITNWDVSFGWGDHKGLYIETESDPTVPQYVKDITQADINKWNSGTGGGGGGNDPRITDTQISNWDDAYGWGNHATQSYATQTWVSQNYQPKGSYSTTSHNHNGVYQPVGNYATTSYSYSKSESDNKYALKGSGGSDPDAVKLTGNQTVMGIKKFLGGSTYFQNLFIEGVPAGGVGFAGAARIEFSSGATTLYGSSNTLQVNASGTSIAGNLICTGTIKSNDNVGGTSFSSTVSGDKLLTVYGYAIANDGSQGAGLYFSKGVANPTITPCRGSDFANVSGSVSLGNPNYKFKKVWATEGVGAVKRHTQNENEAVLSVNDLIDVLASLREATSEEKTVEGLRDSIGNCVGGIIEKLEAIQAETEEQLAREIAEFESNTDGEE